VLTLYEGGKENRKANRRKYPVSKNFSKKLVKFVSTYVSIAKQLKSQRNVKLLINSESWASDFKIGFIGGLLDSDGYVYHNKNGKHYGAIIKTSNRLLGKQIQAILSDLKINTLIFAFMNSKVHTKQQTHAMISIYRQKKCGNSVKT